MALRPVDRPIDLDALRPERPADDFVAAVMARVRLEPAPAPPRMGVLWGIWSLSPRLALAGAVIVVAALVVPWVTGGPPGAPVTVAEALGVPPDLLAVLAKKEAP